MVSNAPLNETVQVQKKVHPEHVKHGSPPPSQEKFIYEIAVMKSKKKGGQCCMGTMNIYNRQPALQMFMHHLMYESPHVPALAGPMKEMMARNYAYERAANEWEGQFDAADVYDKEDPWVFVIYHPLTGKSDSSLWDHGIEEPDIQISDMIGFVSENC
tara:strand:+ start:300 stop:773 length:474 start_codon:yes stop_codon:yes gene_type:complete